MRERTENRPQKGIETRCGGRGATRPTASAARLRAPFSGCALRFNTDAVKWLSLTASLSSASSAIFIWLRMLFSLTTKRGCASSRVPHDARRGLAAAIEACRLRASSLPHRSPFGLAAHPRHESARSARHENVQASRRGHENSSSSIERTNWREDVSSRTHRGISRTSS